MHYNPLDKETEDTINRHKSILIGAHDDFIGFIHHVENQRRAKIQHTIFEEKLNEFTRVDEKDDSDPQLQMQINTHQHVKKQSKRGKKNIQLEKQHQSAYMTSE